MRLLYINETFVEQKKVIGRNQDRIQNKIMMKIIALTCLFWFCQ